MPDDDLVAEAAAAADDPYCYLTTTGRVTGRDHRIEIWFTVRPGTATLLLMAGGRLRSDWVRNLVAKPEVTVELAGRVHPARARVLDPEADADEDALARASLFAKYSTGGQGDLTAWRDRSLPIALDLGPG